jgi:hypothetical protein
MKLAAGVVDDLEAGVELALLGVERDNRGGQLRGADLREGFALERSVSLLQAWST